MKNRKRLLIIYCTLFMGGMLSGYGQAEDQRGEPLFDGKTLKGWSPTPGGTWEVKDGVIVGKSPKSERWHSILLSDRQFTDFVVVARFRVISGDSGFYFRADRVESSASVNGFQVEVDRSEETGGLYETGGRGWVHKPTAEVIKKRKYQPGEWTDLEFSAIGGDVVVKINGVVSSELNNDKGRRKGHFGLQLHGGQDMHVEFRDIRIREIRVGTRSPQATGGTDGSKDPAPNFVLIVSDDAGYVDFGFMGSKEFQTPYLDKLASQGVRFRQAYAGPTCSPSRCGLLSGHYSQRHGFGRNCGARFDEPNDGFPKGVTTLPECLKALGYTTGVIGKWHQGAVEGVNQPLDLGFDEFWGLLGGSRRYFGNAGGAAAMWRNRTPDPDWLKRASKIAPDPQKGRYITDAMGDEAIAMLERFTKQENPFFIFLSFTAPHTPLQAKEQDLAQFPDLSPKRRTQAAMQLAMDRASGRLLERLEELGEADNTYVVFMNDNGGSLSSGINGHLRDQKGTVYEGGVRVPMIIRGPGIPQNKRYDKVVVHRDIMPTFVALAGGAIPEGLDGINLIPHVTGANTTEPHKVIFHRHVDAGVAVRRGDWKLVNPSNPGERGKNDPGHWELYDLANDPSETEDLADKHPGLVVELKQAIADWEKELPKNRWGQFGKQDRNYFDSFTFKSPAGGNWFARDSWHKTGDTQETAWMSCQDLYPNAELVFPLTEEGYETTNDLYSASGLIAMVNRLGFTGEGQVTLSGNPLRFVSSLSNRPPQIVIPSGGSVTLNLPVESDVPLSVKGDGVLTFCKGVKAPSVTVDAKVFNLECDARTKSLTLVGTTLGLRSRQVVDGELILGPGVQLAVGLMEASAQETLILKADRITGEFANSSLKMNGRDYRVIVDGGEVFIAPFRISNPAAVTPASRGGQSKPNFVFVPADVIQDDWTRQAVARSKGKPPAMPWSWRPPPALLWRIVIGSPLMIRCWPTSKRGSTKPLLTRIFRSCTSRQGTSGAS